METELATTIAWIVGLGFLGIVGYKAYSKYAGLEFNKKFEDVKKDAESKINEVTLIAQKYKKSAENYQYQIKKIRNNYDLDLDDVDLENEEDEKLVLSDIAKAIYPKLPPSLSNLLDKEEFQNAIIKTVEKKPDILNTFIDKFLNKTEKDPDQGSINKLEEVYL